MKMKKIIIITCCLASLYIAIFFSIVIKIKKEKNLPHITEIETTSAIYEKIIKKGTLQDNIVYECAVEYEKNDILIDKVIDLKIGEKVDGNLLDDSLTGMTLLILMIEPLDTQTKIKYINLSQEVVYFEYNLFDEQYINEETIFYVYCGDSVIETTLLKTSKKDDWSYLAYLDIHNIENFENIKVKFVKNIYENVYYIENKYLTLQSGYNEYLLENSNKETIEIETKNINHIYSLVVSTNINESMEFKNVYK